jgi:hypothetical protein
VIGREIRRLLLGLVAYGNPHSAPSASTDILRARALSYAGVCTVDNGELAPMCGCPWTLRDGKNNGVIDTLPHDTPWEDITGELSFDYSNADAEAAQDELEKKP